MLLTMANSLVADEYCWVALTCLDVDKLMPLGEQSIFLIDAYSSVLHVTCDPLMLQLIRNLVAVPA
ncbi:hypothetical protein GGTG_13725 [Gaeumannomyces tritici R3-111a-1]|uniref:Uncharacterized protein n=1 Tax=Gaeumannomyces tritici (strain R3-111a-1) TaxID=644352 RepID=J3PJN8_GAET3|nr:hypothetical protein GGTG_13725 [Gaeumannomyces tritici R3-111a-1]EJT68711.1 hypothetical protein GGTG_13725 [Gaeumannomyces tritici R3-111a-1]